MFDYLVKRILIMIPTFLGVSLMIWLVMFLSPGEPGVSQKGPEDSQAEGGSLSDLESKNRAARLFRENFKLNRPPFWNDWGALTSDQVRQELVVVKEGMPTHSPTRLKKARRNLEDWQKYAVRPLVELLESTKDDPELQYVALQNLRQAAYTFRPTYAKGHIPTAEERKAEEEGAQQNRLIQKAEFSFSPKATAEDRAPVVKRWQSWFAENEDKYRFEGFWYHLTDTQFGSYWGKLVTGDFGQSMITKEPVTKMIFDRLKYSLSLALPAFLLAWILAIFLGVFSATNHGTKTDQSIGVVLFMLYSIPAFVMATLLQQWLAVDMRKFPVSGFESQGAKTGLSTMAHLKDVLWHITLPLICYTYGGLAYISRQARSGMLQVLKSDFVRTARAKGLKERTVVWRHAVRNGMMPIVTLLGTALPVLVAGSVFIETVFDIDGFGKLMITSILQKDYNVVMGIQLIVAALTLVGLLLTDLIYAAMDPRISFK